MDRWAPDIPMRNAVAAALSLLIAFVGVVHEVVGSTLYPEGPASFGGAVPWHVAGLALVIAGAVLVASTLGLMHSPVRIVASVVSLVGFAISVHDLIQIQHFHLFATTLALAGAGVAVLYQPSSAPA